MAKTRAQRKAEQRARQAQAQQGRRDESQAQRETQVPESAEVAEAKIVEQAAGTVEAPAPAPSRADKPPAAKTKPPKSKAKPVPAAPKERERQRGAVLSFLASSWAELKRVQWPDRETLVQASAVTLVFVAVAAAYLGALDAAFSFVVKRVL
jgi:preprotein translocase SecE subunit